MFLPRRFQPFDFGRRLNKLTIQRLSIADAPAKKIRPFWYNRKSSRTFRQQIPKPRLMPAQIVAGTVPMLADGCSQSLYLSDQVR